MVLGLCLRLVPYNLMGFGSAPPLRKIDMKKKKKNTNTGTTFYIKNGYKAIIALVPKGVKHSIDKMAIEIGCSRQELYHDICGDYLDNESKYTLEYKLWEQPITIYLPKEMHRNLSHHKIDKDTNLKKLVSSIITSYFKKRSLFEAKEGVFGRDKEAPASRSAV